MASIVDSVSVVSNTRGDFVVAATSIEELLAPATANMVLKEAAAKGLSKPGISNVGGPYPVDAEGKSDDDLLLGRRGPVAGYRRDFTVLASIT
jgi:hypothetical protein